MLEEAYEVAEAIDNRDTANLKEELGDVLHFRWCFFPHGPEEGLIYL